QSAVGFQLSAFGFGPRMLVKRLWCAFHDNSAPSELNCREERRGLNRNSFADPDSRWPTAFRRPIADSRQPTANPTITPSKGLTHHVQRRSYAAHDRVAEGHRSGESDVPDLYRSGELRPDR